METLLYRIDEIWSWIALALGLCKITHVDKQILSCKFNFQIYLVWVLAEDFNLSHDVKL